MSLKSNNKLLLKNKSRKNKTDQNISNEFKVNDLESDQTNDESTTSTCVTSLLNCNVEIKTEDVQNYDDGGAVDINDVKIESTTDSDHEFFYFTDNISNSLDTKSAILNNSVRRCRTCMITVLANPKVIELNSYLINKLQECTSVQINLDDKLSSTICLICLNKLNIAYDFRKLVQRSDTILKLDAHNILNSEDNVKKENIEDIENNFNDSDFKCTTSDYDNNESDEIEQNVKKRRKKATKEKSETKFLKNEIVIKNEKDDKILPALCHTCGIFFTHWSHMKSHAAKCPRIFECKKCGKQYKARNSLRSHLASNHSTEKCCCHLCGAVFRCQDYLNTHLKRHSGIKNYKCTICKKEFIKKYYLTKHIRSHTGERPYVCQYCGRAFSIEWNLKQHVRLHTSEKPYKCSECEMAFRHNVTLKAHVRSKHPNVINLSVKIK